MRYEKVKFTKIVKNSNNLSEIARNIGLNPSKGNRDTIKRYINLYKLDTSHFRTSNIGRSSNFNKRDLSSILVDNSTYSSSQHLKNRLYSEGLKERCCELCGQDEEWNGKKMSLILDHINGINYDNRIENLRIVCPNCNATLDTNCSKNKTKYREYLEKNNFQNESIVVSHDEFRVINRCINCDTEISKNSNRCEKCDKIKQRKVERPPYEQLLSEIEDMGYSAVGRKYGVSDNAVRKWIKNYKKIK